MYAIYHLPFSHVNMRYTPRQCEKALTLHCLLHLHTTDTADSPIRQYRQMLRVQWPPGAQQYQGKKITFNIISEIDEYNLYLHFIGLCVSFPVHELCLFLQVCSYSACLCEQLGSGDHLSVSWGALWICDYISLYQWNIILLYTVHISLSCLKLFSKQPVVSRDTKKS